MKASVLVTGATGLVGSRFVEIYQKIFNLYLPTEGTLDITNKDKVRSLLRKNQFASVVNFAAFTDVGAAEEQKGDKKGSCWQINVEGLMNLASAINPDITKLIHISTDMVFSGSEADKGPYSENHSPEKDSNKVTWYGYTKGEGERMVISTLGEKSTILRLIYPVRAKFDGKLDYLRKPLQLYDQGKLYPMFSDQQVSICFIDEACTAIHKIISGNHTGIFHAASNDTGTPYKLVSYLIEKARGKKNAVKKSSLSEFLKKVDNPVRYPKYGGLKVEETENTLKMKFSTWRMIIDKLITQGIGEVVYISSESLQT
jgi:dTDP-4-dehydrorhamnose reductase